MRTPLILVADDDKDIFDIIEIFLEDKNLTIEKASDGEEVMSKKVKSNQCFRKKGSWIDGYFQHD